MKKAMWYILGMLCVGMAYIGFVTPGIPFSHFLLGAAFCFAKSSERMHAWLYNHKWFGPFLTNWSEKRVFPTKAKYGMLVVMSSSLLINWFTLHSIPAVLGFAVICGLVAVFTWRYPGSVEEWERREALKTNTQE
jgi:uncharacterized membrane protein YbaN (DUF454 family)